MPEPKDAKKFANLSTAYVSELLGVESRTVRNWAIDKGLPSKAGGRGRVFDWAETLAWLVNYRIAESGNGGNGKAAGGSAPEEPEEDYKEALARKTRAEADLMELKLARERGQVAAIADVEKVLSAANSSTRTLIQSFPAQLAPQLVGLEDRAAIFTLLQRECSQLLGNLANMDAILEAGEMTRAKSE